MSYKKPKRNPKPDLRVNGSAPYFKGNQKNKPVCVARGCIVFSSSDEKTTLEKYSYLTNYKD